MDELRYCKRCDKDTERRQSDGRCKPCAARRARDRRAKARGTWAPHKDPDTVPPGFAVKGTSTLRNAKTGEAILTWEKTNREIADRVQAIRDAFESLPDEIHRIPEIEPPTQADSDLLCLFPQGDPHFGMYAWAREAGEDFDIEIAQRVMLDTSAKLIHKAPSAGTAILLNLGDFFHANDSKSRTPKSGFVLDTDSRWPKVFRAGVRVQCSILEMLLQKYERVIVRNNPGNHDPEAAVGLDEAMIQRFWDNPRVEFVSRTTEAHHWYHQFGRCLFGSTHGDAGKHKDLIEVMAADVPEAWGATVHRHWYVGHLHHESTVEGRACTVETFQTTAPSDGHHVAHGYRSGRSMRCHIWHRGHGGPGVIIEPIHRNSRPVTR